ncbi:MAG TPA: flagellin, partial [Lachnospiraceae bacterium]|nr:flagellin [Lachnospiraceae bacterium]
SLIQTAEGALNETHSILQRMRELAVQAANDTNADEDRDAIKAELDQLTEEIDRIATQTEFNTKTLMTGKFAGTGKTGISELNFQVGANEKQNIALKIGDMQAAAFTGLNDIKVTSYDSATAAITTINNAITKVSTERSTLGAVQNRLEHTIDNADNTAENLQAAESRIRDVDMAKEMVKYSKDNILQQAAQSM